MKKFDLYFNLRSFTHVTIYAPVRNNKNTFFIFIENILMCVTNQLFYEIHYCIFFKQKCVVDGRVNNEEKYSTCRIMHLF